MDNAFPIHGLHEFAQFNGLTKREYFAAMALQGLLANSVTGDSALHDSSDEWRADISGAAVEFADATLRALEEDEDIFTDKTE